MTTPIEPRPELDALLGAYVLDALEPDERAAVEQYLERNPRARAEVDDLRETAAVLAAAPVADTTAPTELWTRIAAEVDGEPGVETGPTAPDDEFSTRRARRMSRRGVWIASIVAAAAVVLVALLAVEVISLNNQLDDVQDPADIAAKFDRATETDGAREAELASDHQLARVVMLPDGTGYLVNDDLSPLTEDQTYQLWALVGDESDRRVISAGVLGSDPTGASFKLEGPVEGFALTVEHAGGVPVSANDPIAVANLA